MDEFSCSSSDTILFVDWASAPCTLTWVSAAKTNTPKTGQDYMLAFAKIKGRMPKKHPPLAPLQQLFSNKTSTTEPLQPDHAVIDEITTSMEDVVVIRTISK
jgi:hypothetical protein